jgi:hypothetical protein
MLNGAASQATHIFIAWGKLMNKRTIVNSATCCAIVLLGLCSTPSTRAANASSSTAAYVDMSEYLPTWQQQDAWFDLQYALKRDFDNACGDTFCSGEYTNIQALRYRCSVDRSTGVIGECIWTFAASDESIDPGSGKVVVQPRIWQCRSPLAPYTRAEELIQALGTSRPLSRPLPRSNQTLHYSLSDCLY